ncbi:MAG TPA: hypothetical protein PLZ32_01500 [Saprospiraceae bacterium]|nr:hypothetical protein [Saprospiraceae bacterium]
MSNLKSLVLLPLFFGFQFLNAQSGFVNFDGMFAPILFANQNIPTNDYSDGFVTFTGDWEVLDCATFGMTGFSTPNGLKFNTLATSNVESINFSSPVHAVSFKLGITATAPSGMAQIESFDDQNNSLEVQNLNVLGTALTTVTIAANDVSRIQVTIENAGILDDISYTIGAAPIPTLSQWASICLLLSLSIMSVVHLRKQTAKLA